jgi:hypothetical protein
LLSITFNVLDGRLIFKLLAAQVHTIRLEWAPTVASEFEATGAGINTLGACTGMAIFTR